MTKATFIVDRKKDLIVRGGYNVYRARSKRCATPEERIECCKDRVAAYKYPREVRFVEALPKGPTGKVLKKELHA